MEGESDSALIGAILAEEVFVTKSARKAIGECIGGDLKNTLHTGRASDPSQFGGPQAAALVVTQ